MSEELVSTETEKPPKATKIAFIGTLSSGKTAVFNALAKFYKGDSRVVFAEEAARVFFEKHDVPEEERQTAHIQGRIQGRALERELEAHSLGARVVFCDRSVLDAVVYVLDHGDKEGAQKLLARVRFWLSTYEKIFLLF